MTSWFAVDDADVLDFVPANETELRLWHEYVCGYMAAEHHTSECGAQNGAEHVIRFRRLKERMELARSNANPYRTKQEAE